MNRSVVLSLGLCVVIVLAIPSSVAAQTSFAVDRGSLGISGMVDFGVADGELYEDMAGDPLVSFSIMPSIFYFIAPNLAVGGDLMFEHSSRGDDSSSMYGIGPGILYAFGSGENSTYPYIGAGFTYAISKNNVDITGTQVRLGGGLFILPASQQHLGLRLEAGVTFDGLKPDLPGAETTNGTTYGISLGLVGFIFK